MLTLRRGGAKHFQWLRNKRIENESIGKKTKIKISMNKWLKILLTDALP